MRIFILSCERNFLFLSQFRNIYPRFTFQPCISSSCVKVWERVNNFVFIWKLFTYFLWSEQSVRLVCWQMWWWELKNFNNSLRLISLCQTLWTRVSHVSVTPPVPIIRTVVMTTGLSVTRINSHARESVGEKRLLNLYFCVKIFCTSQWKYYLSILIFWR